jgi:two-component system, LuxR family, sensor kinase FixL
VIVNLTVNALQAMRPVDERKRRLTVTAQEEDGFVVVGIGDSGPGIDPEHLSHLFESFFTTKEGGLGIGLAICRSIVEAHGGRISASNQEGGGALFKFHLPVCAEGLHTDV